MSSADGTSWMMRPTVSRGRERAMPTTAGSPVSSAAMTTSLASSGQSKMQPWSRSASSSPGRAPQAQIAVRSGVLGDAEVLRPPLGAVELGHHERVLLGALQEQAEPVVEAEEREVADLVARDGDAVDRRGVPFGADDTRPEQPRVLGHQPRDLRHEGRLT